MSLTIRRAHATLAKLDCHWPDDLPWWTDIPRPVARVKAMEAA